MRTLRGQRIILGRPLRGGQRSGLTILELMVTLVVLLVAVGGALGSISSFVVLGDASRETARAYLEAQQAVERLRAEDFTQVFRLYNDTAADDPVGGAPGAHFDVEALSVQTDDADGFVGRVFLPVAAGAPGVLREDIVAPELGLPRDLNADEALDGGDHSGDYVILPVRVRVEWRGKSGNRFVELATILRSGAG